MGGLREPREIPLIDDQTKNVYDQTYKSMGDDWGVIEPNLSEFVEPDNTLGNTVVEGWVYISSTDYYPLRFEFTKENNTEGFINTVLPSSGTWVQGWNHCKWPVSGYDDAANTPWSDMTRLELYRSGPVTGTDTSQIIRVKNLVLRKYTGNEEHKFAVSKAGTFVPRVSEIGPSEGLVGWWPLNGNAYDYSGEGNDGTATGASYVSGVKGQAMLFDTYPEHVMTSAQVSQLSEFTYSFWVYRNSTQDAFLIVGSRYGNNTYISAAIINNRPCLHKYRFNSDNDINIASSNRTLGTDSWHHITITYKKGDTRTYVDGVLEGSGNHVNTHSDVRNFQFNYESSVSDTFRYFLGRLCDVRIYNRALSAEEVNILYTMTASDYPEKVKISSTTIYLSGEVKEK